MHKTEVKKKFRSDDLTLRMHRMGHAFYGLIMAEAAPMYAKESEIDYCFREAGYLTDRIIRLIGMVKPGEYAPDDGRYEAGCRIADAVLGPAPTIKGMLAALHLCAVAMMEVQHYRDEGLALMLEAAKVGKDINDLCNKV